MIVESEFEIATSIKVNTDLQTIKTTWRLHRAKSAEETEVPNLVNILATQAGLREVEWQP